MPLLETLQDAIARVLPEKKPTLPMPVSTTGGIGNAGMMPFEDDMIVSKPAIIFHASQAFFNFLAMCCFASVAAFQARWKVGPSGLTGFALFVAVTGILFPLFLVFVPVIYDKYNKGARLARALNEVRVGFIMTGAGTAVSLLIAFIVTISAWTEPGCKDASKDPHASLGDTYKNGLGSWCGTKKAGAVFFWLTFIFWTASLGLNILDWRNGKSTRPRDQPFAHPTEFSEIETHAEGEEYDEADSPYYPKPPANNAESPFADSNAAYAPPTSTYGAPAMPRPSIDAYGAFSDPAPSGFGSGPGAGAGLGAVTPPVSESPRVSRTMQYADPYAAVRATISSGQQQYTPPAGPPPPGYGGGYS